MAFTTGTADDYADLLDVLRLYLIAEGWTVDAWTAPVAAVSNGELFLSAPGSVGGEQPRISIQTEYDTDRNAYAWKLCGATNYESDKVFGLQQNNGPRHYFNLWQNPIDYWFYVNDRRFIVVVKMGTIYYSCYAGFFLPYALPTEYSFPLFVGATCGSLQPYNLDNSGMRAFCDPGDNAASYFRRTAMTWAVVTNHYNRDNEFDYVRGIARPVIWPWRVGRGDDDDDYSGDDFNHYFLEKMRPTLDGRLPLWQAQICDAPSGVMPGMLDGVFCTPGFNRVTEQLVSVGGSDYRLFQNGFRSRPKDFYAIEEA